MNNKLLKSFKAAFPLTIPIMAGFLFLGATYGILMNTKGFGLLFTLCMSLFVFAGSMQFVAVNLLLSAFNPIEALFMTLMINARHLFYGISMLNKYSGTGLKKFYLIFGMCDESFSINCFADIPEDTDKNWFMFFVTLLNHIYWVAGTLIGCLFGSFISFNTEGIDFAMTAMFTVIFTEQLINNKNKFPAIAGLSVSVLCLIFFGPDKFIIPTMLSILAILSLFKSTYEKGENKL